MASLRAFVVKLGVHHGRRRQRRLRTDFLRNELVVREILGVIQRVGRAEESAVGVVVVVIRTGVIVRARPALRCEVLNYPTSGCSVASPDSLARRNPLPAIHAAEPNT